MCTRVQIFVDQFSQLLLFYDLRLALFSEQLELKSIDVVYCLRQLGPSPSAVYHTAFGWIPAPKQPAEKTPW